MNKVWIVYWNVEDTLAGQDDDHGTLATVFKTAEVAEQHAMSFFLSDACAEFWAEYSMDVMPGIEEEDLRYIPCSAYPAYFGEVWSNDATKVYEGHMSSWKNEFLYLRWTFRIQQVEVL